MIPEELRSHSIFTEQLIIYREYDCHLFLQESLWLLPGPYLGTLRPWAQEIFAPPTPLFVRIQLCSVTQ